MVLWACGVGVMGGPAVAPTYRYSVAPGAAPAAVPAVQPSPSSPLTRPTYAAKDFKITGNSFHDIAVYKQVILTKLSVDPHCGNLFREK